MHVPYIHRGIDIYRMLISNAVRARRLSNEPNKNVCFAPFGVRTGGGHGKWSRKFHRLNRSPKAAIAGVCGLRRPSLLRGFGPKHAELERNPL